VRLRPRLPPAQHASVPPVAVGQRELRKLATQQPPASSGPWREAPAHEVLAHEAAK